MELGASPSMSCPGETVKTEVASCSLLGLIQNPYERQMSQLICIYGYQRKKLQKVKLVREKSSCIFVSAYPSASTKMPSLYQSSISAIKVAFGRIELLRQIFSTNSCKVV